MIREKRHIKLDGVNNGIVVQIISKDENLQNKWISIPNKEGKRETRVFSNLEIAKLIASLYYPDYEHKFYFTFNKYLVQLKDCQKISDNVYQAFVNGIRFNIEEFHEYRITDIGYIVFENGDIIRCNAKDGFPKMVGYYKNIEYIITNILLDNSKYGIESIKKSKFEMILKIKNTSARIHIMQNHQLMDINQKRKSESKKALPFNKQMDKFLTFYVYISKDLAEPIKNEGDTKSNKVLTYIINDLQELFKDSPEAQPKFIPVEIKKTLRMEDL